MKEYNHTAIRIVHPTASTVKYSSEKKEHTIYDKDGNLISIDESKVKVEHDRLQAEWEAQAYARARQPLYPDIGDQLDDLYHKGAFSADMAAKIKKVKDDNPKG